VFGGPLENVDSVRLAELAALPSGDLLELAERASTEEASCA